MSDVGMGSAALPTSGSSRRVAGLVILAGLVVAAGAVSLAVGSKDIPLRDVLDAMFAFDGSDHDLIIRDLRIPRTVLGLAVGGALGVAGVLMQGLTRNPLADPGILGVNAGAAFAVVIAIYSFGIADLAAYVWFAIVGAAVAGVVVYGLGTRGRSGASPAKLALAGAAMSALLGSFTTGLLLLDAATLDQFRFWVVGSVAGRDLAISRQVAPFLLAGTVIAASSARRLDGLALGDDMARSLGQNVTVTRLLLAGGSVLLVGGAVAAAGPVGFVGLAVPHAARALVGPPHRWLLPYAAGMGAVLVVAADTLGRVLARPAEIQVGIVTALVGAPYLVMLVRRRRLAGL